MFVAKKHEELNFIRTLQFVGAVPIFDLLKISFMVIVAIINFSRLKLVLAG